MPEALAPSSGATAHPSGTLQCCWVIAITLAANAITLKALFPLVGKKYYL